MKKPKTATVPRWESPAKKQRRFDIRRLEFALKRGFSDRRDRERAEAQLEQLKQDAT